MSGRESLQSLLDSVATTDGGDLLGFSQIETDLASLAVPRELSGFRAVRKKLLDRFAAEYRSTDRQGFLAIIGVFAEALLEAMDDQPGAEGHLGRARNALDEYLFDCTHQDSSGTYPLDYFDNLIDDAPMLGKFVAEAREHLQAAQLLLLEIESDPSNTENLNTLFRAFHTIKGSAGFLGVRPIEDLAHEFENLLSLVREGRLRIDGTEVVDILFHAIKEIEILVDILPECDFVRDAAIERYRRQDLGPMIKLARAICASHATRRIGEILEDFRAISPETVDAILMKQAAEGGRFGQIAAESGLVPPELVNKAIETQRSQRDQHAMVKVAAARLNAVVDLAGELVIIQSMIKEGLKNGDLAGVERTREQLEVIATSLKELALSMGMVPMGELFNRLRVVARNTARELGKAIDFCVQGEETELDRKLVEVLYDPLVHMVRNAIDHGIEPSAERKAAGKPESGRLLVAASHRNSGIELVIEDSGRGIDPSAVADSALSKGLIDEVRARQCRQNPAEAYKLLFLPGFSTKQVVSEISGRGVGMDVVKTNLDAIGAHLDIWSKPGKGSRFTIRVPLSLAIIEGFVCLVRGRRLVLPFGSIAEVLVWPPQGGHADGLPDGVAEHRGDWIPVVDARSVFAFGDNQAAPAKRPLLVLRHDEHTFGLIVDEALGSQEIVIKSLDEMLERIPCVSGGSIFGDGSIGFVVSLDDLAGAVVRTRSPS